MTIQAVQTQSPRRKITSLLLAMGIRVDKAVDQAITGLLHSHTHAVAGLMENAVAVQELESSIDQAVFSALESGDMLPSEIRLATSVINISKDLARLSKLAANLGRRVGQVGEHCDHEDFSRLQPMAIAVSHLCRQTLRSLIHLDPVLARSAATGGSSVDAYRAYVLRNLGSNTQPADNEQNIHLIFASRCLEQIADHAVDLAENLVAFLDCTPAPQSSGSMARQQLAC
ncbi:MAG TPA: phosphate uptake regulator PhoU [Candidatus Angelobacter sp.]|nr:phosphate uptake regulator PhoU [Candidatus Angelobacter sp.]